MRQHKDARHAVGHIVDEEGQQRAILGIDAVVAQSSARVEFVQVCGHDETIRARATVWLRLNKGEKKIKSRILVTLQMHHGKNREIRRLFNKINRKLFSLKRVRYGDLELGNLPLGKFRELNKIELNRVQQSIHD